VNAALHDETAEIRRRVTRHVQGIEVSATVAEAIASAKHLRPGDTATAIRVHAILYRKVADDLRTIGCADECLLTLVNVLCDYIALDCDYRWSGGRWSPPAVPEAPRLRLVG
jgi:hypothetical protein